MGIPDTTLDHDPESTFFENAMSLLNAYDIYIHAVIRKENIQKPTNPPPSKKPWGFSFLKKKRTPAPTPTPVVEQPLLQEKLIDQSLKDLGFKTKNWHQRNEATRHVYCEFMKNYNDIGDSDWTEAIQEPYQDYHIDEFLSVMVFTDTYHGRKATREAISDYLAAQEKICAQKEKHQQDLILLSALLPEKEKAGLGHPA